MSQNHDACTSANELAWAPICSYAGSVVFMVFLMWVSAVAANLHAMNPRGIQRSQVLMDQQDTEFVEPKRTAEL